MTRAIEQEAQRIRQAAEAAGGAFHRVVPADDGTAVADRDPAEAIPGTDEHVLAPFDDAAGLWLETGEIEGGAVCSGFAWSRTTRSSTSTKSTTPRGKSRRTGSGSRSGQTSSTPRRRKPGAGGDRRPRGPPAPSGAPQRLYFE